MGLLALALSFAGPALAWQYVIQGNSSDYPVDAVLDESGDLILIGFGSDNEDDDPAGTLIKLEGQTGRELWRLPLYPLYPYSVLLDLAGNPIAVGGGNRRFRVSKHSGFTGFELWQTAVKGSETFRASNTAAAAALDPWGDVVAVGYLDPLGQDNPNRVSDEEFAVVKFEGATGAEIWRWTRDRDPLGSDTALAVAVDGSGDVVAVGGPRGTGPRGDFLVVKLSSSTGSELWRVEIDGTKSDNDRAHAAVIDAAGDVIAAGHLRNSGTGFDLTVVKLSGASGAELWRAEINALPGGDRALAMVLDPFGDVIAAGSLGGKFGLVKLAAATGAEIWRATAEPGTVLSIALDGSGDVFAAGEVEGTVYRFDQDYMVAKFSGATGAEAWRSRMRGSIYSDRHAKGQSVLVPGSGDIVVAGQLMAEKTGIDFVVRTLRTVDGVNPRPMSAKRLILRERAGRPETRKLLLVSKGTGPIYRTVGADPTEVGASLEIINPATGESAIVPLPKSNWEAVRWPGRLDFRRPFKKWLYRDRDRSDGPCKRVDIQVRDLRVVCSGEQIPFTLDESPGQGSLEVRLKLGGDGGTEFCWVLEGDAVKRDKSTTDGPVGSFVAKGAPAPVGCPVP